MFKQWETHYPNSWFQVKPGLTGFLPIMKPLEKILKPEYAIINDLLDRMKLSNENSLLGNNKLAETIESELPLFTFKDEVNTQTQAALFRDYCFMASAYSLETSHYYLKDGVYGKARENLPEVLSKPLLELGEKLDCYPWLDYAYGYGLNNAVLKSPHLDPGKYDSYKTCRMFNGNDSESGFINVHVAMNSYTGELTDSQQKILESASNNSFGDLTHYLNKHYSILNKIIETLQQMWKASKKSDYLSFRTFIMGQKGNSSIYENEVINFSVDGKTTTFSFRGETGAQDSIIPSVDNLFQINYPKNKLTEYLYELRSYRPPDHQKYIEYNQEMAQKVDLLTKIYRDPSATLALFKNINILRVFRKKHWNLTKKYIINNTSHPVATGGTPITTWLPNQLGATINRMFEITMHLDLVKNLLSDTDKEIYTTIKLELTEHRDSLYDEVHGLQNGFSSQDYNEFKKK